MSHRPRVSEDLIVITSLVALVAEEVDGGVVDATGLILLVLDMLQGERLVPALGEDVKGDLAADGVSAFVSLGLVDEVGRYSRQAHVREGLLDVLDEFLPYAVLQVMLLILVPLLDACVPADGADVDHAVPELNKGTPLLRDFEVRNVVQYELDELLVLVLADPLDEGRGGEGHAHAVRGETILGEAKVEERCDVDRGLAELFLLLHKVGPSYETNCDFVTELGEELKHFRRYGLAMNQC